MIRVFLLLALALAGCSATPATPTASSAVAQAAMDPAALCAPHRDESGCAELSEHADGHFWCGCRVVAQAVSPSPGSGLAWAAVLKTGYEAGSAADVNYRLVIARGSSAAPSDEPFVRSQQDGLTVVEEGEHSTIVALRFEDAIPGGAHELVVDTIVESWETVGDEETGVGFRTKATEGFRTVCDARRWACVALLTSTKTVIEGEGGTEETSATLTWTFTPRGAVTVTVRGQDPGLKGFDGLLDEPVADPFTYGPPLYGWPIGPGQAR